MKRRIVETYHFERDVGRDNYCHRTIDETIGMLGGGEAIAAGEERVLSALNSLQQGFTLDQFLIASIGIMAAMESRENRHLENIGTGFSDAVIAQTRAMRVRFLDATKELLEAISDASIERRNGFEKFRTVA